MQKITIDRLEHIIAIAPLLGMLLLVRSAAAAFIILAMIVFFVLIFPIFQSGKPSNYQKVKQNNG
jgi:hypothetical protein